MKIETVVYRLDDQGRRHFDAKVNSLLSEGWALVRREVLPGADLGDCYFAPHLYAELAKLDPSPEPEQADPMAALRAIQAMCLNTSVTDCNCGKCPLDAWCQQLAKGGDPTDWDLPGEEAAP